MVIKKFLPKLSSKNIFLAVILSVAIILSFAWLLAPVLADLGIRQVVKSTNPKEFDLVINQLDPWETSISNIVLRKKDTNLSIESLQMQYDPSDLAVGELDSFTIRNMEINIDGKAVLDHALSNSKKDSEDNSSLLQSVCEFLTDPSLKHFRVLGSKISVHWPDFTLPVEFEIKGDYDNGLAMTTFDGSFAEFPFLSQLRFWAQEKDTYADIEIEFTDLNKSGKLRTAFQRFTGFELSEDFSVASGNLVLEGIGRVEGNQFTDLFLEFNGSEIDGVVGGQPLTLSKIIAFLTPHDNGNIDLRSYANIAIPDYAELRGLALDITVRDDSVTLRPSVQLIEILDPLPEVNIQGLSLPVFDLNLSNAEDIPLDKPYDFYFDSLSFRDGSISLNNGGLNLIWYEDQKLLSIKSLPMTAVLTDFNVRFFSFSLDALINPSDPLNPKFNQVITCDKVFLAEDSIVEDLSLTFKPSGQKVVMIDSLSAKIAGVMTEISPANFTVSRIESDTSTYSFEFLNTDIRLGKDKFILEGLSGSILIHSFDPLITGLSNEVSFKKIMIGDLELENGNLTFEVNEKGEFVINDLKVKAMGGSIEVESAKWEMYSKLLQFQTTIRQVNGQRIADYIEGLDLMIEGNFSGIISFTNYGEVWDFGTGFLQLDPSASAHMKFKQGDLIYGGIQTEDPESKKLKLTAWALEDLKVDAMRVNFKVLDNERQVIVSISGVRETEDQKVELDYKPRFLGGLQDLLTLKKNSPPK
jgi:hypothetical protein